MQIEFLEPAFIELNEAIEYYNSKSDNLGFEFFEEIKSTLLLISKYPEIWSPFTKNTRKAQIKRFPFNIIYTISADKIFIVAIAHQHRKPGFWKERF